MVTRIDCLYDISKEQISDELEIKAFSKWKTFGIDYLWKVLSLEQ